MPMQRHSIRISKRDQFKVFPIPEHLSILSRLHDVHGFSLVTFKRKRDNYSHAFKYELKLEKPLTVAGKFELCIFHDGYLTKDVLMMALSEWLESTKFPGTHATKPRFEIEFATLVIEGGGGDGNTAA